MNNSEQTAVASPTETFATQPAQEFPLLSDQALDQSGQGRRQVIYRNGAERIAEIDYLEDTNIHELPNAAKLDPWPLPRTNRPDFGLWLLYGSTTRHDRWERFRRSSRPDVTAGEFRSGRLSEGIKRSFDITISLFLLTALLPLLPLISVVIKLDSSGPVFFRHYRIGKNGRRFVLWKFRSMRVDVPQYAASPRSGTDARLTRVGKLIRRLSVDEMPQLLNVLKGEMSLVGPRPEMPFIVDRFHPVNCERLAARPGITGLWQISPARAAPIHENLQYDLHYVRNQNFILDCAIIARTITAVIRGIGAV